MTKPYTHNYDPHSNWPTALTVFQRNCPDHDFEHFHQWLQTKLDQNETITYKIRSSTADINNTLYFSDVVKPYKNYGLRICPMIHKPLFELYEHESQEFYLSRNQQLYNNDTSTSTWVQMLKLCTKNYIDGMKFFTSQILEELIIALKQTPEKIIELENGEQITLNKILGFEEGKKPTRQNIICNFDSLTSLRQVSTTFAKILETKEELLTH